MWATNSKQFRFSRLPVVIDKVFSLSPLPTVIPETVYNARESYRPFWRDFKINESITIQQCHVKEREHRHGVVGEDSILYPQDCVSAMSASIKDKWNSFGVCSLFHPFLYLARRCTFGGSWCMKSEKEVEDHDVLVPFVCLAKMSQRVWIWLSSILLTRDATATRSMDFRGSTCQMLKTPVTLYAAKLAIAYLLRLVCTQSFVLLFDFFSFDSCSSPGLDEPWRQFSSSLFDLSETPILAGAVHLYAPLKCSPSLFRSYIVFRLPIWA